MTYGEIEAGADLFGKELAAFVNRNGLRKAWFEVPDHVAIKCANRADFEQQITELRPLAESVPKGKDLHGRTLGTVTLAGSLAVGGFGRVKIIEVMEPRPAKVGVDPVGFEHMEFYYPEFDEICEILDDKKIPYEQPTDNPHHGSINVMLGSSNYEVKFNNKSLAEIVAEESAKGENYDL